MKKIIMALIMSCIASFVILALTLMGYAEDKDAVYLGAINADMQIHPGEELHVLTFILTKALLHKDIDLYIWMDNVKDNKNQPSQNKYFADNKWVVSLFNQIHPVVKFNSFSPYYNYVLPYGIITGIKSFTLNVCVKESVKTFLPFNIPLSIPAIKASGVCGLRLITIS